MSDESFDPVSKTGTSAFVIITHNKGTEHPFSVSGDNWSTGSKAKQSPYCIKLAGIIGVLTSLAVIIQRHHVTTGTVTIALNGESESAMNQAKKDTPLHIAQQSFDDYFQEI